MASPNHLQSEFSKKQERNVFIWNPSQHGSIAFSWRVDRESPMTIKTMYRWIETMYNFGRQTGMPPILIFRVEKIERSFVMAYDIKNTGDVLPPESQNTLDTGHYCTYARVLEGGMIPLHFPCFPPYSHYEMESDKWVISESLRNQALARDDHTCYFTSDMKNLETLWIIPPRAGYRLVSHPVDRLRTRSAMKKDDYLHEQYMVVENCLTMHQEVAKLFRQNAIGIDVDDDYRIVCFDKRNFSILQLKTHFAFTSHSGGPADEYLRCHFTWCLLIHTTNGDISFDYEPYALEKYMNTGDDDSEDEEEPETPIAKLVNDYFSTLPQEEE